MKDAFLRFLFGIVRAAFSLRYSVTIEGLDKIPSKEGKLLFLPNHTALIDPLLLCTILWPKYKIRPLVLESFARLPAIGFFIKQVKPIPIPDFETSVNQYKIVQAERSLQKVVEGLHQRDNLLVYPSGKLKTTGSEVVGGNSAVETILEKAPECRPVLVRVSGFWGSSFSKAPLGRTPDMGQCFLIGLKTALKNLLFFTPRRKIYVHFEEAELPRSVSRRELNEYLERWYNQYRGDDGKIHSSEPLKLVSYSVWREEFLPIAKTKSGAHLRGEISISSVEQKKIYSEIQKILKDPQRKIAPEMNLMLDLGMDSLNIAELIVYLSRNYETAEIHPGDLETVEDALKIASGEKKKPQAAASINVEGKHENRPGPALHLGKNLPDTLLKLCKNMGKLSALGDNLSGELTYQQLLRAVIVLARSFQKFPEQNVGVMLPSSVGAMISILALQFAGKTPVMLNWTLGPRYLEQMMQISGAKRIISSWRFFERLSYVEFGEIVDQIVFLEDVKKSLSLKEKLSGALLSLCPASFIRSSFRLDQIKPESSAVILFTSGTESVPKGVPLTHANMLSNFIAGFPYFGSTFKKEDVLLAILPVFHSFGFTGALFFLCLQIKVVFSPDPTDHFAVAQAVEQWKATSLFTVPLFLKRLFQTANPAQLQSLREICVGGDKATPDLYETIKRLLPKAMLREGYGITECSPVVCIQRDTLPPEGAGQLLVGIEAMTIHPETHQRLPEGAEGEVCISGPTVFNGYLGNVPAPFLHVDGKKWYRTGDIGHVTPNGSIVLTGRLKRFAKIGGEMISLGAIEDVLVQELKRLGKISAELPSLAVCTHDTDSGPKLVVFSTFPIEKEQANELLRNSGFSRLIKIDEVHAIDELPLMGSGKTDYRSLQSRLAKR